MLSKHDTLRSEFDSLEAGYLDYKSKQGSWNETTRTLLNNIDQNHDAWLRQLEDRISVLEGQSS